ncbi:hypothetical protein [Sulfitobacter sp. SK012]|uniref:hypothetical protein n=1 Tax=Sulfitobacter sp. SK012 TaxID=1389005 RepID=UPI0013B43176|nr:hypothetical protein [Sulfitobacter sp. SK012]
MENTYQQDCQVLETPGLGTKVRHSAWDRWVLKALVPLFQPQPDLTHLSARLREDARIDEHKTELSRFAKAPLIR